MYKVLYNYHAKTIKGGSSSPRIVNTLCKKKCGNM